MHDLRQPTRPDAYVRDAVRLRLLAGSARLRPTRSPWPATPGRPPPRRGATAGAARTLYEVNEQPPPAKASERDYARPRGALPYAVLQQCQIELESRAIDYRAPLDDRGR